MSIEYIPTVEHGAERGRNVTIEIDLVRHPEKDPRTGNITEKGKADFQELLETTHEGDFDAHRIFVSPHKRAQQVGEFAEEYMTESGVQPTVRTRHQLLPYATHITPVMIEQLRQAAIAEGLLSPEAPASVSESTDIVSDPSEESERGINTVAIQDYYDELFPATTAPFSGRDIGESIDAFIHRLIGMTKHLNSGSRVKMTLVSHSGFIEYFVKLAYLREHPEESADMVTVEKMGGLLNFNEGPKIVVHTDETGTKTTACKFRDMEFSL